MANRVRQLIGPYKQGVTTNLEGIGVAAGSGVESVDGRKHGVGVLA